MFHLKSPPPLPRGPLSLSHFSPSLLLFLAAFPLPFPSLPISLLFYRERASPG